MRYLYSLILYLLLPVFLVRLLLRSRQNPAYRHQLLQRFGFYPHNDSPLIWLHAVSVGEVIAASPLIEAILDKHPKYKLIVSNTTPTGAAELKRRFGETVQQAYFPFDLPGSVDRALKRCNPSLVLIMETEVWPNLIHHCHQRHIPVLLVNARLSQRSQKSYQRFNALFQPVWHKLTKILARDPLDAKRFQQLGVPENHIAECGNLKYALKQDPQTQQTGMALRTQWPNRPVWIAASTHPGEDEIIIAAHQQLMKQHPDALMILAPRHPERADSIRKLLETASLGFSSRSLQQKVSEQTQVYLLDTLGEMILFFHAVDAAFIGGSLVPRGGHNPLEAIACSVPVLSGPYVDNFENLFEELFAAGAAIRADDSDSLAKTLIDWFDQPQEIKRIGALAKAQFQKQQSVVENILAELDKYLS